eukprot:scaffold46009_cov298-Isochrysis_galbana.AAC.1
MAGGLCAVACCVQLPEGWVPVSMELLPADARAAPWGGALGVLVEALFAVGAEALDGRVGLD